MTSNPISNPSPENPIKAPARGFDLSAAALHLLAMALMLMDHLWATLLPAQEWMTCLGRLAFPIFAFMAVEGYFHTHSFRKYALRMLLFAALSEVPFDLMYGGTWYYPVHQNVIWTLLLGLLGIRLMEWVRRKGRAWLYVLTCVLTVAAGAALGTLAMVDYYGVGVLTVFLFYFFRGRKWWCLLGQAAGLYWLNVELLGASCTPWSSWGWRWRSATRALPSWPWCLSGSIRAGRGITPSPFNTPATRFIPRTCWPWRLSCAA